MDEPEKIIYDELSIEEIEREHARLSVVRFRLDRGIRLMNADMTGTVAGREFIKLEQQLETELTRMQAAMRRLRVPDEG